MPKIYIIILNYNGWADTIECLESVLRNDYPNYQVIVVDNNSPNNSMDYIKAWAEGKIDVWVKPDHPLKHLSFPPVKKPIPYVYYTREEAEKGGNLELEKNLENKMPEGITTKYPLVFIQTGYNGGFSFGNNVGIKYALAKDDFEYVWLLNNDTVIERNSLYELVRRAKKLKEAGKNVGILGSLLIYYNNPEILQGIGAGSIKPCLGKLTLFYQKKKLASIKQFSINKIDHINGASFLISKDNIKTVGLLNEEYFMYVEETDYCLMSKRENFDLDVEINSKVYHKQSISSGGSYNPFVDYYFTRNTIILLKKFYPICVLPASLYITFTRIPKRLVLRKFKNIKYVFKGIVDGLFNRNHGKR